MKYAPAQTKSAQGMNHTKCVSKFRSRFLRVSTLRNQHYVNG